MSLAREILAELKGMFLADARLSAGVLAAVIAAALLAVVPGMPPLAVGAVLTAATLAILVAAILRGAGVGR